MCRHVAKIRFSGEGLKIERKEEEREGVKASG